MGYRTNISIRNIANESPSPFIFEHEHGVMWKALKSNNFGTNVGYTQLKAFGKAKALLYF